MKKTSKILSLLVALCMAVTMLSGLTVFAADPFEVVAINADTDFITLDFDQEIAISGDSGFVLKKDGEFVDFTIAKKNHKTTVQTYGSRFHTYILTPEGGVEAGAEYKLTFWDVKSSDGASTHAQVAYSILVEQLADFADFIPFKQQSTTNTLVKGEDSFTIDNATVGSYSSSYVGGIAAVIGADREAGNTFKNAISDPTTSDSGAAAWTEKDYTFKVTYTQGPEVKVERLVIGVGQAFGTNFYNNANYKFHGFYMEKNTTTTPSAAASNIEFFKECGGSSGILKLTGNQRMSGFNYADGLELKFAIKDGIVHGFADGKKVFDYQLDASPAGFPFLQVHVKSANTNAETGSAYTATSYAISNPVVSRANIQAAEIDFPEGYVPPQPEEPEEEEYPEMILDWDADLDVFTVDFEEEIASLDATITQAGTIVPATVYFANYNDKAATSRYTWIVEPTAGFVRDIPYTVTLANVKNEAGTKKISTWSKTFKVEVLAEGLSEDVTTSMNSSASNATFVNDGEDLVVTASAKGGSTNPNDTDKLNVFKTLKSGEFESDYTVKVTLKDFVNIGYTQGFVGITSTSQANYGHDHSSLRGAVSYAKLGASATSNAVYSNIYQNTSGTNTHTAGPGNFTSIAFRGENPVPVELKLAVKNGVASSYWNGKKTADATLAGTVSGRPQMQINLRSIVDTAQPASVTYADFIATRAVHADVLGESFTVAEPELTGAFTDETVAISTVVTNNTLVEKAIFAMCALYDATGAMKNVVIAPVEEAVTGDTTVEFEGVETNGATYAKIFIWDGADTLNAWFPAIIVE